VFLVASGKENGPLLSTWCAFVAHKFQLDPVKVLSAVQAGLRRMEQEKCPFTPKNAWAKSNLIFDNPFDACLRWYGNCFSNSGEFKTACMQQVRKYKNNAVIPSHHTNQVQLQYYVVGLFGFRELEQLIGTNRAKGSLCDAFCGVGDVLRIPVSPFVSTAATIRHPLQYAAGIGKKYPSDFLGDARLDVVRCRPAFNLEGRFVVNGASVDDAVFEIGCVKEFDIARPIWSVDMADIAKGRARLQHEREVTLIGGASLEHAPTRSPVSIPSLLEYNDEFEDVYGLSHGYFNTLKVRLVKNEDRALDELLACIVNQMERKENS
jgi:hypothetical protein